MVVLDAVDIVYGTPTAAQAFATASSPSGWKILFTPTGAMIRGLGYS